MPNQDHDLIIFVLSTIALILLLLGVIVTILYFYQLKQSAYQQELKEINMNYDKSLLHIQLEIQEQTFQAVSKEIHDNISLGLTLSKLHLNTLHKPDQAEFEEKIEVSVGLISDAIQNLRNISRSLNSDIIKNNGLLKAIENEIELLNSAGVFKVKFEVAGTPAYLENQKELVLFRIVQEAINNIIKHSKAENIKLAIQYGDCAMHMIIRDDGIGFTGNDINWDNDFKNSAGLRNIRHRVQVLNGKFEITSSNGHGTKLEIHVPLSVEPLKI